MNGRVYDAISAIGERRFVGGIRAQPLPGLKGEIVEIGAGTGASFPYYDPSVHLLALEPDRSMLARAKERAKSALRGLRYCTLTIACSTTCWPAAPSTSSPRSFFAA